MSRVGLVRRLLFFQTLGSRIAEQRRTQNLTQAELGELVGVTQQQIASFEVGRRRMPISTLPLLASALGVSIEALIGDQTIEPAPMFLNLNMRISSGLSRISVQIG
jgi:transcriptional regulator with XRE-family HTH domain